MSILICFLAVIFGLAGGMGGFIYLNLPNTEELIVGEEVYYTYNDSTLSTTQLSGEEGELSVHFLELGNKYTGDCTYIKYGDVDIFNAINQIFNRGFIDRKPEVINE